MHEFSTAQMILDTVLTVARGHLAVKILQVNLEIGELTLLNPEQLKFSFDILTKGTKAEGAHLKIRRCKAKMRCETCGYEGAIRNEDTEDYHLSLIFVLQCPKCGGTKTQVIGGKDCNIRSIKVKTSGERA